MLTLCVRGVEEKIAVPEDDRRRDEDDTRSVLQVEGFTARLPQQTFFLLAHYPESGDTHNGHAVPKFSSCCTLV